MLGGLSALLTSIGLVFDIAGVLLLFRFGLPPDVRRLGTSYLLLERKRRREGRGA